MRGGSIGSPQHRGRVTKGFYTMITKTITFEDLEGNSITRDFYFNLNKAEILKMQLSAKGGLDKKLNKIVQTNDYQSLLDFISELVLMAYGEKDDDGIKFVKTKDGKKLSEDFEQSEAYSELLLELTNDVNKFNEFINGIIPKSLSEQIKNNNK